MTEKRSDIVRWTVAGLLTSVATARWAYEGWTGTGSVTDTIVHLVFILICLAFGFGKAFTEPAKEVVLIVVKVLPFDFKVGGRRRSDPPTDEHVAHRPRKPKIEEPPEGAEDI